MKLWCKLMLVLLAGFCAANMMPAQNLMTLPADPSIKTGQLPNGTHYYVIGNKTIKGVADVALVQRTGTENIDDTASFRAISIARESLASLPRCTSSVQSFVTSHGVTPGREGFVKVSPNSTEYRFNDIVLSESAILDSTLLVVLDIIDRVSTTSDPFLKKWYAPADQAIIISGDVNPADVVYKLQMMSMMTPYVRSAPRKEYEWENKDSVEFRRVPVKGDGIAAISFSWRSPRTPEEFMNTVQPTIYEMFLSELGMVIEDKVGRALYRKGIPLADISCRFLSSDRSAGDEVFNVNMSVADEDFDAAVKVLAGILAGIDSWMVSSADLARVKRICTDTVFEESRKPIRSNSTYVDKCITSFLYNGSLATLKSKVDFLASRQLNDSTELRLFNSISSALLDPQKNLTVSYSAEIPRDSAARLLDEAWIADKESFLTETYTSDDIPAHVPSETKMKVRKTVQDPMSGGQIWTFSNGFTVIYKKMQTGGRLYYSLARNGGYGLVPDLKKGEGACFSDLFLMSEIGGLETADFMDVLNREGISMVPYVGLSYMMLSGYAPVEKAGLLLRSLIAAVNDRVKDSSATDYYMRCESLKRRMYLTEKEERIAVIDSIICPDYRYSSRKLRNVLAPELPEKADKYFNMMSEQMNDGVLILLGDMDETELRKLLVKNVDGFRTEDKAFKRQMVRYQPPSGRSTYTMEGEKNSIDIAMSVPISLTTDNFMAAEIAAMVLEKNLSEAVMGTGMYLEVSNECKIYPQERLSMLISLNETSPDGFAAGLEPTGPIEALAIVRSALYRIAETEVTDSDVAVFKTQLKSALELEMADPYYWLDVISRRQLAGKDFTTNYKAKIDAVTTAKVKNILSLLNKGTRVEYIISGE